MMEAMRYVSLRILIFIIFTCSTDMTLSLTLNDDILNGTNIQNIATDYQPSKIANKISLIQNEMQRLKDEVALLKTSENLEGEDLSRVSNLENIIELMKRMLESQDRELQQTMANFQKTIVDLIQEIGRLRIEQEETRKQLLQEQLESRRKSMVTDVIVDIKSGDFKSALETVKLINNKQKYRFIINEIYRNQEGNFDLIIRFAKMIVDQVKCFTILNALFDEMKMNGHRNLDKLIALLDTIQTKTGAATAIKVEVERINKEIKGLIESEANTAISADILTGIHKSSEFVDSLTYNLHKLDKDLYNRIILNVVKDMYKKLELSLLLSYFESQWNLQKLSGFNAVYEMIKSNNHLNSQAIVTFALSLKKVISYRSNVEFESLKSKLPECIRNIVFEPTVCIKSVHHNEYLYAAVDSFKYDKERRRVFTWKPGNKDNIKWEFWTFESQDGNFYIRNNGANEYMYAAVAEYKLDDDRRSVFTWIPGGRDEKGSEYWKLEPFGEHCYIKSIKFNEYFFSIGGKDYDNDRRNVATWIPTGCDTKCLWKIEVCGN